MPSAPSSPQVKAIPNAQRRKYAINTCVLDEVVGNVTSALTRTGAFEDTFIVVARC